MNKNIKIMLSIVIIVVVLAIAALYLSGTFENGGSNEKGTVDVLAGAGFSKVAPDLVSGFNKKYPNIKVNVKYGGSGELFATLQTQKSGDIFLPADYKYMGDAMKKGYVENSTVKNITKNIPVLVVAKGNPKNITSLKDLTKSGVKVAIGDANGPAIGKTTAQLFEKNNLSNGIESNVVVKSTTVNQLLTYLVTGQCDATIIWKDMTSWEEGKGKIEVINIPDNENIISTVPIGVTIFSKDKDSASKFQEFITSEEGKKIWKKWGFEV